MSSPKAKQLPNATNISEHLANYVPAGAQFESYWVRHTSLHQRLARVRNVHIIQISNNNSFQSTY
jgi:hypothetical protein